MIPQAAEPRRLHPATLLARWLKIVPQMAAGGIAFAATAMREGFGTILLYGLLAAAIAGLFALLFWWRFTYRIGPGEIVIEKGLLSRQRRVIPFDRIQDIAIEQKLLARLFGTAKVKLETGGSGADEGNLDMVALADAHALRDHIRRGPAGPATAAAEAAPAADEPVLFALDVPRLLLSGLFNFSLIFLAAIIGVAQYLEELRLIRWEDWFTAERGRMAASLVSIPTLAGFLLLVILLGIVAGVARTVARDYGFCLTRAEAGFRRRRGLFTLSEVVIPIRRTQVALIESGPVARRLGWYSLSFQTLGADRKEGGVQVAAPFARMEELLPILAEAGFPPPPAREAFDTLPRRALVARALPWLALGAIAGAAALMIEPYGAVATAAMLLLALVALLRWRKHAWRIGESALFVSSGVLRRRLWIVPYEKTQAIIHSRGPLQRAFRLGSVLVDTAGASSIRSPELADLDADEAERARTRLLELFGAARDVIRLKRSAARRPA